MTARRENEPLVAGGTRRRKRITWFAFAALGCLLAVQWLVAPLVVQTSRSMPRGVYVRSLAPIGVGSVVMFRSPEVVAPLLEAHGKATSVPLLKPVVGVGPMSLDTTGTRSVVGGVPMGPMEQVSSLGVAYPEHRTNRALEPGQVWVESSLSSSVDSRTFGPVDVSDCWGPYVLLWGW